MTQYFGKYRGKVTDNQDPLYLGRIQVTVPAIYGPGRDSWAMPCTPYAGADVGFFTIPPVNANVWVEFEGGNPDYPIWSGCFWGTDELPQAARVAEPVHVQVFKTDGIIITLSNLQDHKKLSVEVGPPVVDSPLKLVFDANGIELNNNNQTTVKLMAETIELKSGKASTVTIAPDSIQLKESSVEVKLTANDIELNCSPATLKLSISSGIEMVNMPSTAKLTASGIELNVIPATVKLTPAIVELSGGGLGNIKISPIDVNVNNGALEVT